MGPSVRAPDETLLEAHRDFGGLQGQHEGEGRPNEIGFIRHEGEIWHGTVCQDGEGEEIAVRAQCAEFSVYGRVKYDLEGEANDADDCRGKADLV